VSVNDDVVGESDWYVHSMRGPLDWIANASSSDEVRHLEHEPELDVPRAVLGAPERDRRSHRVDMSGLINQRTFRSSRYVIPGLAAG
jgi:hypothetical protein